MKIIGVSGKFRTGKETVVDILKEQLPTLLHGPRWSSLSFADKVKETACVMMGVDLAFINHWKNVKEPPPGWSRNVRELLQLIGEEARTFVPDNWIQQAHRRMNPHGHYLVEDVRHFNEASYIHSQGGVIIRVQRPSIDPRQFGDQAARHSSEVELDSWDAILAETGHDKTGPIDHSRMNERILFDYLIVNDYPSVEQLQLHVRRLLLSWLVDRFKYMIV